jgi:hypothetical protein
VARGLTIDRNILKVLKALAELEEASLGELMGRMFLHALEGTQPFSDETLATIAKLKQIYGLTLRPIETPLKRTK